MLTNVPVYISGSVLQCCMGAILEAAQRGSHKEVMSGLYTARAGVLSLLPAIAGKCCCFRSQACHCHMLFTTPLVEDFDQVFCGPAQAGMCKK